MNKFVVLPRTLLVTCVLVATAILGSAPQASGQILLSDTFADRGSTNNLGNFNNAFGGSLPSSPYFTSSPGSLGTNQNLATLSNSSLYVTGGADTTNSGLVTPNVALGTGNFSVSAWTSSSLTNPAANGTYKNSWMVQLRRPAFDSFYSGNSAIAGMIDIFWAPNGQFVVRSWNGTSTPNIAYNGNPFTGSTTANNWTVGAANSLPTTRNGFAFDTNGNGNIDNGESFLFGASISGSTLNLYINGQSLLTTTIVNAAPAQSYVGLAKQRQASGNTITTPDMIYDNLVVSAATTNSALTGTAVSGFRVMQNGSATTTVSLANSGSNASAYTLGLAGAGSLSLTGSTTGTVAASGSQSFTVGYASTATTGARSGTVTIANLGTLSDTPTAMSVAGAVVTNRVVSASAVNLGNVLVSATTAGQSSTVSTTGDDNNYTRITVNGTSASGGGVTVAAGTTTLFDAASVTTTRSVTGSFGSSGAKSGTVGLSVTGEGLAGETVGSVGIAYTATAYDPASLSKNQAGDVVSGGTVSLSNAAGSFRAGGSIASRSLAGDGGWSVSGLAQGAAIAAGATASGTASFDTTGKLNGTYVSTFTLDLQNDQSIQGASAGDLGTMSWNLSQAVSGQVGGGSAAVGAGRSLAGFSGTSQHALGTVATLLAGETDSATTVTMSFAAKPGGDFYSDVLDLHGTNGLAQVLQLDYDPISVGDIPLSDLLLGWKDGDNWVNAVNGNTGQNPVNMSTPFLGSWADYVAAGTGRTPSNSLGAYGVDGSAGNKVVWAVVNHNSEFAVIAVPEPAAMTLAGVGVVGLAWAMRRRLAAR
jgi:hypothetical protein